MPKQEFNLQQIRDIITFSIQNSEGAVKLPVALWGSHGVGKTETVKNIAAELPYKDTDGNMQIGYNVVTLHLATQDVCDLIGIPRDLEVPKIGGEEGEIDKVTIWSCPDWLRNAVNNFEATGQPNLFFLDEMNRGNRMVLAAMLPFLINGTLHTHTIAHKDAVICAMNPATDDYEVNELIDKALLDRLAHATMRPTREEYIKYLEDTGMDKITLAVVKEDATLTKIPDFDLGFEVSPSRRSIDYVMRVIGKMSHPWIKTQAFHIIEAFLGATFRDAWLDKYSVNGDAITIEMLQEYDEHAEEITRILTTEIDGETTARGDLVTKSLDLIKGYIADKNQELTVKDAEWMMKFCSNSLVDDEYAATIFQANPVVKEKMTDDIEFSIAVGDFLREKGIWEEADVEAWN